jgi:hypothetical protein
VGHDGWANYGGVYPRVEEVNRGSEEVGDWVTMEGVDPYDRGMGYVEKAKVWVLRYEDKEGGWVCRVSGAAAVREEQPLARECPCQWCALTLIYWL